jgi:DNA-binding beta-propeller fold protein YncE
MNRFLDTFVAVQMLLCSFVSALRSEEPALERVQVIDLAGPNGRLDHLALDRKHGRLFVANMANSSLDIVDLRVGKLVKQIPGQKGIQGIAYAPDLDRIFAGVGEDGVCNVFDGANYQLLKSLPMADADNVRYEPRHRRVYVSHAPKGLAVIDAQSLSVITDIALPAAPESFQLEKDRARLYLNTPRPSQVVVVDTEQHQVIKTYPVTLAHDNYPMALDEANHRIITGCRRQPKLVVLDSESGKEVAGVPIPGDTDDVFYDGARKRVYVSCGAGSLAIIRQANPNDYEADSTLPTVKVARTSFFDPVESRLYLVIPRHEGSNGPQVWIYQARP